MDHESPDRKLDTKDFIRLHLDHNDLHRIHL